MPQFVLSQEQKTLLEVFVADLPDYRKRIHISQAELAKAIGKSRQKISEIESGTAPLGWDTFLAILTVLGARGALEPKGSDADLLAATGKIIGGRLRFNG